MADYAIGIDDAEMINVCLECRAESCDEGLCPRYRIAWEKRSDKFTRKTGRPPHIYVALGQSHTMAEWCKILGVSDKKLRSRMQSWGVSRNEQAV